MTKDLLYDWASASGLWSLSLSHLSLPPFILSSHHYRLYKSTMFLQSFCIYT